MLVIGSVALLAQGISTGRPQRDIDYICTFDEYTDWVSREKKDLRSYVPLSGNKFVAVSTTGRIHEFEIAWPDSSAEKLLRMQSGRTHASLGACLTLKLSHRYLKNSPAFLKTMDDIHLLRRHGVEVLPHLQEWQQIRELETYDYKHPSLNRSKKDFFDTSVAYVYDHDSIHRAVATFEQPAYVYYRGCGKEVYCSKSKFFDAVSEGIRLAGVLEEAYVLALERSIIPHPGVLTPRQAFDVALMKVCTSITSGWFREFAWENYHQVCRLYSDDYVTKFKAALAAGNIPLADKAAMMYSK